MARDPIRLPAFLRLDPVIGWRRSALSGGIVEDAVAGTLGLEAVGVRIPPLLEPGGSLGGLTTPTGVALGPAGEVLVADPEGGRILRHPHQALYGPRAEDAPGFVPLWPPAEDGPAPLPCDLPPGVRTPAGPYDLVRPRGLCFTRDGDLAVTDEGDAATPGRLLVFGWPGLAARAALTIGGRPWDVALDGRGRLLVADAGAGRVRRFDRLWREDDWPGGAGVLFEPRHLLIDSEDRLHVLDTDPATRRGRLSRLDGLGRVVAPDAERQLRQRRAPPPLAMDGPAVRAPGSCDGTPGPVLRRVRVDAQGRLPEGPHLLHRPPASRFARQGRYVTEALDGGEARFAWHRVAIQADLPAATAIALQTFTAEAELEPERLDSVPEEAWSRRIVLAPDSGREVLVQSPPGRWLWLRLGLTGDGTAGPTLHGIDVLGPRRSSLRFLPEPFHEDPVSRDFLDRFLSYFDTVFAEVHAEARAFVANLSPQGAREGAVLAWLASWFDLRFLARWPDRTRRAFLAQVWDINRLRGTVPGLRMVLRLHLDAEEPVPALVEDFRLRDYAQRRTAGSVDLPEGAPHVGGVPLLLEREGFAHRFTLVVPEALLPDEEAREDLIRLVDLFRPAHTAWTLVTVPAGVWVGCQSTLGVDMILGGNPEAPLGEMRLGQSTRLGTPLSHPPRLGSAVLRGSPDSTEGPPP